MNVTPEHPLDSGARLLEPTVPRQHRPVESREPADLLRHPDPVTAADAAAVESLLRCWVREMGVERPEGTALRLLLPASGACLRIPVPYWSATGWHRFGQPALQGAPLDAPPVDAVTLAALLTREAAHAGGVRGGREGTDLVARVADSTRRTAEFIAAHRRPSVVLPDPERPEGSETDHFLAAERSLVLGHPLHPTPKSREGFTAAEAPAYSPELSGSFVLNWLAVDPAVLTADSAWTESGKAVPAQELARRLAGEGLAVPGGFVPLPLHPWQAREIRERPEVATLFDAGLLRDLGPYGSPWCPTSSVRTVYRTWAPVMLKLSLGLRITNSRRENLRKELHRGVEVHRLLRSGLAARWRAAFPGAPGFDIVRDPAWLGVDTPAGRPIPGLDVVIRHNPFAPADDALCVAALTSPLPTAGAGMARCRLQDLVESLAVRTGRSAAAVSAEWFLRYLEAVVRPVLWLDAEIGVALEAHQQNTVLLLDADGWPAGGRYRDNQGYYFRASRRDELERRLPGVGAPAASDSFVTDDVADERFTYYLGINNVLGLIGAFGASRLVDERVLLAAFRGFLERVAAAAPRPGTGLPARLLESAAMRCKANLLTRVHGLDELVGPVDTQSVYVTVPNPLAPR